MLLLDNDGNELHAVKTYKDLRCLLTIAATEATKNVVVAIVIKTLTGTRILSSWTEERDFDLNLEKGDQTIECRFENVPIRPGRQVVVELWMSDGGVMDHVDSARVLDVVEADPCGFSVRSDQGAVLCPYSWSRVA